jgi:tetratricopeptide (TPR) repeat protein
VQHPNVVAVFDAGEEQGRPFIVTELLRGKTLRERFAAGPLPLDETLRIARQAAAGLAAAHEKGLTHRDLKPENIFITLEGWVKILDFGLVKLAEDLRTRKESEPHNDEEAVTGVGRMLGTVGYMAPEQVRGRPVDPRADLFNFGAVLYEMLSGKRAFRGASPTETGYATLFKQPEPLPDSTPRPVRELVARCLEKDPQNRFASGKELVTALDALSQAPAKRRVRLSVGPRTWLAAGAAVALAALVVAGLRIKRSLPVNAGPPPSGTVAILPFSARDAPHFAYLGEGVVDLLARDLEGSELRALDSGSVLRALGGDSTNDVDRVRAASAQLSARYFLLGRIEERRGELVLEAVLHTQDAGLPVSQAVAQGAPADLLRLVRKLSDQLQLRPLQPKEFEARLDKLARRTSRSTQALEAWLEGERLLKRGRWVPEEVIGAFQRAVAADPEFALAHYRLATQAVQVEPGLAEDSLIRALRNSERLTPVERMLVEGQLAVQQGRLADAERDFLESTRRYPDDAESWMQLAELYFHENPLRARSPQESLAALQRVLVIDPLNTEAMSHVVDLAQMRGERGLASRLSDRLLPLSDWPWSLGYRLTRAWARGDADEDRKVLGEVSAAPANRFLLKMMFLRAVWQMDGFADAEQVAGLFGRTDSAVDRSYSHYTLGFVKLLRGQPEAARAEVALAAEIYPGGDAHASYFLPWIDTLDFVPATSAQLAAARAKAEQIAIDAPQVGPARLHVIGALAARGGDWAAAEKAARELEQMAPLPGSSVTTDLALAVRARVLAARGDAAAALELLEKQQLRVPARYASFHARIAENWLRGGLLEALHRPGEALLLSDALTFYLFADPIYVPVAHLRKAKLLEALGDRDGAIEHYARFIELWKDCEPGEKIQIESAQSRLAALRANGPSIADHR